jgi:phosphoglycolate phosphatase
MGSYMTHFSSVIIDFDGTLFDTRRAISATLYETFAVYNVPPPSRERVEAIIGRGITLEETLTQLMPQRMLAAQLNEWALTYRRIYNSGTGIRASTPFPGSRAALAQLHATKPDPHSYFQRIVPVLGTAACEHVLVAGDTDLDILYARRIGATACWAAYGYGNPDECRLLHPEFIARPW